jgi:hypothetical protein
MTQQSIGRTRPVIGRRVIAVLRIQQVPELFYRHNASTRVVSRGHGERPVRKIAAQGDLTTTGELYSF